MPKEERGLWFLVVGEWGAWRVISWLGFNFQILNKS